MTPLREQDLCFEVGFSELELSEDSGGEDGESMSSSNVMGICQDLAKLFNDHNYYEILTLIPSFRKRQNIPVFARAIIALTLYKLGRVDVSIRELSLAIEMCSNVKDKEKLIGYLSNTFRNLSLYSKALCCVEDLILMKRMELLVDHKSETQTKRIKADLQRYEAEYDELDNISRYEEADKYVSKFTTIVKVSTNILSFKVSLEERIPPVHVQVEYYLSCDGRLGEYSLGRASILTKGLIDDAQAMFNAWSSSHNQRAKVDPLQKIFAAIKKFAPLYLFDELRSNKSLIENYIDYELNMHPEISYLVEPKTLLKQMKRWNHNSSTRTLMSLCGMIIKHQIVLGFLVFSERDYERAALIFRWALSFFLGLHKSFKFFTNKNEYLSSVAERVLNLLLITCYNLGSLEATERELEIMLSNLVKVDDLNLTTEYINGRLTVYFISCGYIYESLASKESYMIAVEDDQDVVIKKCKRFSTKYIGEMIRKYIIAAALKAHDDPTSIYLYDKIIWGLLVQGGMHLQTFWLFVNIRNYFVTEHDHGPLRLLSSHQYKVFANDDSIGQYSNGWELVDRIYELWNNLTNEEKECAWDFNNGNLFLIPQVFEYNNSLILADLFFDENSSYSNKSFVQVSDHQVKHKLKGHIKISANITQEQLEFSKEIIYIWSDSYLRYHGMIPDMIHDFLRDTAILI